MIKKKMTPKKGEKSYYRYAIAMEMKVVCYYCGTIYDGKNAKCPLCGSSERSSEPVREALSKKREMTQKPEETKGETPKKKKGKYAAPKKGVPHKVQLTIVILLSITALLLLFFIGDMIGWWPGFEEIFKDENATELVLPQSNCTLLRIEPEEMTFDAVGDTGSLKVVVNANCEEQLYCNSGDESVARISTEAETGNDEREKYATFTVTAYGVGQTEITVACGSMSVTCPVVCEGGEKETEEPTEEVTEKFVPELNADDTITMEKAGETFRLEITNLPAGAEVEWDSSDDDVVTVDENGLIEAISEGTATVTATVDGEEVSVEIVCEFEQADSRGPHLETNDVTLWEGESFYLYLYDEDSKRIRDVTYEVGNPSVCEVEDGYVTALSSGTTTVTVIYNGNEYPCIVRVP